MSRHFLIFFNYSLSNTQRIAEDLSRNIRRARGPLISCMNPLIMSHNFISHKCIISSDAYRSNQSCVVIQKVLKVTFIANDYISTSDFEKSSRLAISKFQKFF